MFFGGVKYCLILARVVKADVASPPKWFKFSQTTMTMALK